MPRIRCPKCEKVERILKAGLVRNKQRYLCKDCNYHFIIESDKKSNKLAFSGGNVPTSLSDIAKAAGVSTTTVSRALNNRTDISEHTRNFIQALATSMKYQPNVLAQSLVNRSTHTLGVIIPNLDTTIFSTMLSGIQEVASKAGYRVIICNSNESHETEIANIQGLMNNMIDGLLICHTIETSSFEHVRLHLGKRIPIVQFYRVAAGLALPQILPDDVAGAEKVTEYLIKMKCKKIAILLGPKNLSLTLKRLKGYENTLQLHDIIKEEKLLAYVDFTLEKVINAVDHWLEIAPDIDAIISISDKSAVQIIRHLKNKKIKVPEHIRVFGFGNEFVGEIVEPQLSTFDTHTRVIGQEAARLILEQIISGNRENSTKLVTGKLIIRDSA